MDADHFDTLSRSLTIAGSRRRTLAAALAGALAVGRVTPDAAIAGTCKRKPGECEKCTRTKRKHGKKKSAKITAKADGTPCSVGSCRGGSCVAAISAPPPGGCPARRICGATCCPEGQVCGSNGACVHPSCCNGDATCGPHTTVGRVCCVAPRQARCCCDTTTGAGNGYVVCCMGTECPVGCASGAIAAGGQSGPPDAAGICVRGIDVTQPSCPA